MNTLSSSSNVLSLSSSSSEGGFDTPSLPLEITYSILEQIAESAETKEQLERDVKAFMIVQAQVFKRDAPELFAGDTKGFITVRKTIMDAMAFSKLHACNAGRMTPRLLGLANYTDLLTFVTKSGAFLKILKIDRFGIRLTDERAQQLGLICPRLERLALFVSPLSDAGVGGLIRGKPIRSLQLSGNRLTSAFIQSLKELPLIDLSIDAARHCTDEAVQALLRIKSLKHLRISYADHLTDRAFDGMERSALESIELIGLNNLTDEGVATILEAPSLKEVSLKIMPQLTGSAFSQARSFRDRIRVLNLTESSIDDSAVAAIADFTALSSLVLNGCKKITSSGVALLDKPAIGDVSVDNISKKKRLYRMPFKYHVLDSEKWLLRQVR